MFIGEHEYKVDEKGRVPIPPKFREEFQEGIILAEGADRCITAYTVAEWHKLVASLISDTIISDPDERRKKRFFGSASELALDGQGRVALPPHLRQHAAIGDTAVIVGAINYIEFWNKELWAEEKTVTAEYVRQVLNRAKEQ